MGNEYEVQLTVVLSLDDEEAARALARDSVFQTFDQSLLDGIDVATPNGESVEQSVDRLMVNPGHIVMSIATRMLQIGAQVTPSVTVLRVSAAPGTPTGTWEQ